VFALADRITVLRDGAVVRQAARGELSRADLISAMIGRDLSADFPAREARPGAVVLDVADLRSPPNVRGVSFAVRAGEILGVAGLAGAGRTSMALAIAGARPATGSLRVRGRVCRFSSPQDALHAGVVYVTEDRKARGIVAGLSTAANLTLAALPRYARAGVLDRGRERAAAADAATRFDVRAASLAQPVATLSGGNQQKVLLARAVLTEPAVLLLDEPTRGVDVGARAEIYAFMNGLTAAGLAIVMISSDLPEVLGMSDRILVMREGRSVGELERAAATAEAVMSLAARAA
jgi:ABC-type sugar transport system ATPase subunit